MGKRIEISAGEKAALILECLSGRLRMREAALRAAMFGVWDGDFWRELGVLLAYLVPALLLGLVLRRPVIRLNEWFEHRLERTRLM